VRVHVLNLLDDVLGDLSEGRGGELEACMRMIADEGRGVVVLIREPRPTSLSDRVRERLGEPPHGGDDQSSRGLREIGIGAQILLDLGVRDMTVLSNTKRPLIGLEGYGLTVIEQRPIPLEGD
jgi:3,4-dihydroxy 2-butanone 4-phosphate synthase/GTP cyclohydrolase II